MVEKTSYEIKANTYITNLYQWHTFMFFRILKKLDLYGSEASFPLDYPAEHNVYNVFLETKHLLIKIFVIGSLFSAFFPFCPL